MNIHHLNCLNIVSPITEQVIGHCMLIDHAKGLTLIDTGIGLLDTKNPLQRIGQPLIEMAGFRFHEELTAYRQIEQMGLDPELVTDCVLSHLDPDHAGGLADFPNARVHVSSEEYSAFYSGNPRYLPHQLDHNPEIITYLPSDERWFDFEARRVPVYTDTEMYLIPLFGHTTGHCGVAIKNGSGWIFFAGDAYYMRIELTETEHPVKGLAALRADNNNSRLESLQKLKDFRVKHPEVLVFGYHDISEF